MTLAKYTTIPIEENNDELVDLSNYNFVIDSKYFKNGMSNTPKLYIRKAIALKLEKIQNKLSDYKFKIWDAYRPQYVQENIYQDYWQKLEKENPDWNEEKLKEEVGKFVSPTNINDRIPPHATGGAIDLTLVNKNGKELNMGTEFDYFGPEASSDYQDLDKEILENRKLLHNAMKEEDFTPDTDEWWHFDYGDQLWALRSGKEKALYGFIQN
ncbi:MAG: M15 family metallopeptidase [Bacteroidales bacterium]|nr:M15 family metallopeptidase [Bacteroidales bacterium]